jgi:hypothetical protein
MLNDLTIARLGPAVAQLKRIADALEIIVQREYGYTLTPTPAPVDGDESDVLYTTDDQVLRQQLQDFVDKKKPSDVVDTEDYPT